MNFLRRLLKIGIVILVIGGAVLADSQSAQERRLWQHAQQAIAVGKFDVANITLHTLVNTDPHSKYAARAKQQLLDPRILATCGNWSSPPACDERQLSAMGDHKSGSSK